jgi:hypothetical protein
MFEVGNFIRLAIRDDYVVKLRLYDISYNPCSTDGDLKVTFTNIVNSNREKNDFTSIFDSTITAQKNSIS